MKVLWIVNTALGPLGEKLYGKRANGKWMDALLTDYSGKEEYELIIATTGKIANTICIEEDNIKYYVLPNNVPKLYDENNTENIKAWKAFLETQKPDLILVWGTEFTHGLCALRLAKKIPSIIYMQGYLASIARYYFAGMSEKALKKSITIRDIIKNDTIRKQRERYIDSSKKEKEMLLLAGRIITENRWCEESIKAVIPNIRNYHCPLSINKVFAAHEWHIEKCEAHSIICTASGYPLKGLHMVLRAVSMLKDEYPDIKLYVPGNKMISENSIQWQLRKQGYTKYIEHLVKTLQIEDKICWLGFLNQDNLAEIYEKSRVFVLSSSIENHSSSLKEAMMVGVPSIAATVGGIPEYVENGRNALLYRFEEYEILAFKIKELFESDDLAQKLSETGKQQMRTMHSSKEIFETMNEIFNQVMEEQV